MARIEDVEVILQKVLGVFEERHKKYGTKGMFRLKAIMQASTKMDRILNGLDDSEDSEIDLIGYAIIMILLRRGLWFEGIPPVPEDLKINFVPGEIYTMPGLPTENPLLVKSLDGKPLHIHAPKKAGDCGYDIEVAEDTIVPPKAIGFAVPSKVAVKVPDGYFMLIINRSSAIKRNLVVVPGVIDSGYTGALYSVCNNQTDTPVVLNAGDRVAQGILLPSFTPSMLIVDELPSTERGATGFGSTG